MRAKESIILAELMSSYSTSMFTKEISGEEWTSLVNQTNSVGRNAYVHPILIMFAANSKIPSVVAQELNKYMQTLAACRCWYCEAVRPLRNAAGNVSLYDAWLKQLLYINGEISIQLN